jgi:hypothetical protein
MSIWVDIPGTEIEENSDLWFNDFSCMHNLIIYQYNLNPQFFPPESVSVFEPT